MANPSGAAMHIFSMTGAVQWLQPILGMGMVYQRFFHFLPWWMLVTALTAVGTYLACRHFEPVLSGPNRSLGDRACRLLYEPLDLRHDWAWIVFACGLLLLSTDYYGFTQGFFRWDDFAFVQDARENLPLLKLVNMYHNDHSLPLFRLWVSGIVRLLGPTASATSLSQAFNIVNYLTCLGVLLGGVGVLAECKVRRATAIGFCVLAWSWPGWGEFTTGFYTLIVYPQTLAVGLFSIILALRYLRGGRVGWMIACCACALLASGLDVSGVWVVPAIGGFAWAMGGWRNRFVRRMAPLLLFVFMIAACYHLIWFKHPFEGREFEQNPRGYAVSHNLLANLTTNFWKLPLAIGSGIAGTLTSEIMPGMLGMMAPRFYGNASRSALVYAVEALVLAFVARLVLRQGRRLSPEDRRFFTAIALPVLILISMTGIARVHGLNLPGSFWPSKYFCVPQVWAVLAAVFLMDRTALGSTEAAQRAARWIAVTTIAVIWMFWSHWCVERALAIHAARQPAGREGNLAVARLRRADFDSFQRGIAVLANRTGDKEIAVPPPDGIYWALPFLEFGYGPVTGGSYQFTDLLSVAPSLGVTLKECPLNQVPQKTLKTIEGIPLLKRVFDPEPPMVRTESP